MKELELVKGLTVKALDVVAHVDCMPAIVATNVSELI
jgi:hypothetical protein